MQSVMEISKRQEYIALCRGQMSGHACMQGLQGMGRSENAKTCFLMYDSAECDKDMQKPQT